jgi:hypothetical protein
MCKRREFNGESLPNMTGAKVVSVAINPADTAYIVTLMLGA